MFSSNQHLALPASYIYKRALHCAQPLFSCTPSQFVHKLKLRIFATFGVRCAHHRIRLSKGTKHNITVWLNFLNAFNGRSFFYHDIWNTSSFLELYTDAAASKGYGAILGQRWFFGRFLDTWQSFNITFLELFPIILAVRLWSCHMSNRCIVFVTDNAALVSVINQQISKNQLVMTLICDLV